MVEKVKQDFENDTFLMDISGPTDSSLGWNKSTLEKNGLKSLISNLFILYILKELKLKN